MSKKEKIGLLFLLSVLLFIPAVNRDEYILYILIDIFIWSAMAISLGIMLRSGIFSLGHAAFMAIGSYTTALLVKKVGISFWFTLPIAGGLAIIVAILIGIPILRTKGMYFVLVTCALCEIVRLLLGAFPNYTGGYDGIRGIPAPQLGGIDFANKVYYYYVVLSFLSFTLIFCYRLWNSEVGKLFRAIGASEILTQSLGVPVTAFKVMIFAIGSFFPALCGCFLAPLLTAVNPEMFSFGASVNVFLYVVLGGVNSIIGPAIGTFVAIALGEGFIFMMELTPVIFGVIIIFIILFLPDGLVSLPKKFFRKK